MCAQLLLIAVYMCVCVCILLVFKCVSSFPHVPVPVVGISWAVPKLVDRRVAAFFYILLSTLSWSYKGLYKVMVIFHFPSSNNEIFLIALS